jgi:hypothetical protein
LELASSPLFMRLAMQIVCHVPTHALASLAATGVSASNSERVAVEA